MKIGIIGYGFVGKQVYNMFSNYGYETVIYDPAYDKSCTKDDIGSCDLAVIAVPTNKNKDGSCDTSIVEEVVSWIEAPLILIKSAVEPGTTDRLKKKYEKNIVVSPEYCGESKYDNTYEYFHHNMTKTPWIVIGGSDEDMDEIYNILLPVVGPEKKWHFLKAREAELVKYMENVFYASKVALVNEFYDISKALDCDWKKVREAWLADTRISPMHTAVFNRDRGFDGKCYPKDLAALIHISEVCGYSPEIIKTVQKYNKEIR